jgi:hypothetical protein
VHECTRDRGALLHAAREFVGALIGEVREPHGRQQLERPRTIGGAIEPSHIDIEHHVLEHRAPIKEDRLLKDDATLRHRTAHWFSEYRNGAGRRRNQSRDETQQRRFPTTGRSDHRHKLAGLDIKVHVPNGDRRLRPYTERLVDAAHFDAAHAQTRLLGIARLPSPAAVAHGRIGSDAVAAKARPVALSRSAETRTN